MLLCLWCACGPGAPPEAPESLILAFPAEPVTLNPIFLTDQISFTVSGLIFNGLTRFRPDLTITGDLAASWHLAADGKKITFFLRRGVKWHDGREFTARDVVFTYEIIISPEVPTPLKSQFGPVAQVREVDRYTVAVRYTEPFGSALESWSVGIVPHHLLESALDPTCRRRPVGTGPYRLHEWAPGQRLILTANSEYFEGTPGIPRLTLRFLADAATRFMEFKTGAIHLLELTPGHYQEIQQIPQKFRQVALYRCPGATYGFLGFNLTHRRFQDPRVRLALGQAIHREAIVQLALKGLGRPGGGPYPPGTYYHHEVPPLPYDPAAAKATLTALGFLPGPGQGEPAPLTLITNYENRENQATAEIIQQNFAALGLPVKIQLFDWLTFRHVVINRREFDLIVLSRHYLADPDLYALWHSSRVREGEWNFLGYKNAEVDRLLEEGRDRKSVV